MDLSLNFQFLNFLIDPIIHTRDVLIKAKFYRDFENIKGEVLPKFGTYRVPLITLFQQKLENAVFYQEIMAFTYWLVALHRVIIE